MMPQKNRFIANVSPAGEINIFRLITALFEPFEEVISSIGCSSKVVEVTKTSEVLLGVKTAVPKVGLEDVD